MASPTSAVVRGCVPRVDRSLRTAVSIADAASAYPRWSRRRDADRIALQEDAEEEGGRVTLTAVPPVGRFIRPAGFDIPAGGVVMRAGQAITARSLGLLATAGIAQVRIRRRPRVAILSTGDELVEVGRPVGPDQIVDANRIALIAAVTVSKSTTHPVAGSGAPRNATSTLKECP